MFTRRKRLLPASFVTMVFSPKMGLGVVCLIIVFGGYLYFTTDWDERAVRQQLESLIEYVEKNEPGTMIDAISRGRQIDRIFVQGARLEYYPGRSLPNTAEGLAPGFIAIWNRLDRVSIRVLDHTIDMETTGQSARSRLRARCRVDLDGQEGIRGVLDYRIYWVKEADDWQIERIIAEKQSALH